MPGLLVLPDEILELIVHKAPAESLLAVQATCRRLRALRNDYLDLSIVIDDGSLSLPWVRRNRILFPAYECGG